MPPASLPQRPLSAVRAVVHRAPVEVPVRTSFGVMRDRPAVFLRVTDDEGVHGYGEVWCNFPNPAAEHRKRLADEVVGPLLLALQPFGDGSVFARLMQRLNVLAIQSGEWGPLRQVAAGLDAAVHDLAARRAGLPLYRYLDGSAAGTLRAYASGIGPERPAAVAESAASAGHAAFKVKVGFGRDTDRATVAAARRAIGPDALLMADANQGWAPDEAAAAIAALAPFGLHWVEEPLAADRPLDEWQALQQASPVDLAAGENVDTEAAYERLMASGAVRYIQPDVAKWGGVSLCLATARAAAGRGLVYCPHFLGGGVGLLTSAHLLAAAGGEGMLEIDTNPNPLRETIAAPLLRIEDGRIRLFDAPGIGPVPDSLFA